MSDLSARLGLPYLMPAQAQKHVTHNEALARLDLLVQLVVQGFEASTPPETPQEGQIWALGPAPTGAWAGQAGALAAWVDGVWQFIPPQTGWRAVQVGSEGAELRLFTTAGWAVPQAALPDSLPGLGINTSHDSTNRLAVAAEATLLSHAGAGHQLKLNKAAATDTASLLFQTGWGGRAEMGTAGTDDFAIKVSADGSAWADALVIDRASGRAALPNGATIAGTEAYRRGNILGTVSQSGGVPTGAVIDAGANANGHYVRFADGTMITATRFTITESSSFDARLTANATLPAAFHSIASMYPQLSLPIHSSSALSGVDRTDIESWGCAQPGGTGSFSTTQIGCSVFCKPGTVSAGASIADMYLTVTGRWF
ncbi:DUF2793 domain-containing protein [Rhodobacteraceae bacterium 2376]|uniref:DUF2793 domain-containing protein n=1 Tax=Rhabdonatronobacter sediminivivens TaxID=2743469 RepID=A0A7Z0I1H1_9RHOB|nr:DUF2793 domain-containing protein [Rhabdonatronobacter sediminivivens]NYS26205.1 DUF2793 domain-containing protein [Rhabdonatronobacter sediminivivens]